MPLNCALNDHTAIVVPSQMPTLCPHPTESQQRLFAASDYITGDPFVIERCRDCANCLHPPSAAVAELARYYPSQYYGGGTGRFPAPIERPPAIALPPARSDSRKNAWAQGKCPRHRLRAGFLLREFREREWQVHGTEFSAQSAAHARDVLQLPMSVGDRWRLSTFRMAASMPSSCGTSSNT
jgi:hypothetical protein